MTVKQQSADPLGTDRTDSANLPAASRRGADLRNRSVRSGAVTVAAQVTQFVMQTASTVILARLLLPRDFGITAMVYTVTAFARIFKDLGLSAATIQRAQLHHLETNTLFWVNVLVGTILTLAVAATAPALAWFYQKPEVVWVAVALSVTFLISSLGIQHSALLNREMRFRALAITQVASGAIGILTSILAALVGLRYWALVLGTGVTSIVNTVLLWAYSDWRPDSPSRHTDVRALFRFGADVTGFDLANYFSRNFDNILVGRVWGAQALGLYSRAYAILMVPITNLRAPLNAVAFPALAQLQGDPERFRSYFRQYAALLAFASMPVAAFMFVCSDNAIGLLLGERWAGVTPIFEVLALVAFMQPVTSTQGLVTLACGFSRRYLWLGVANAVATVAAFGIGVVWGPVGVAAAYVVVFYLTLYPNLYYGLRGTPVRLGDFFGALARAAVASVAAGAAAQAVKMALGLHHDLTVLAGCGAAFAAAYLAIYWLLPGGRDELREFISHLGVIVAPRDAAAPAGSPAGGGPVRPD